MNYNKPIQQSAESRNINKTEPMKKNEYKQENWRQPNPQQPHKMQRINQLQNDELQELNGGTRSSEEFQTIPDDLISNSSHVSSEVATSSAFLGE